MVVLSILQEFHVLASHSKLSAHRLICTACLPRLGTQTAQTSSHIAAWRVPLNSDLSSLLLYYRVPNKSENNERKHHSGNSCGHAA